MVDVATRRSATRQCKQCNAEFVTAPKRGCLASYCSYCRPRKVMWKIGDERKCVHCKTSFVLTSSTQHERKYCSDRCKQGRKAKLRTWTRDLVYLNCKECDAPVPFKSAKQSKFCSEKCRADAWKSAPIAERRERYEKRKPKSSVLNWRRCARCELWVPFARALKKDRGSASRFCSQKCATTASMDRKRIEGKESRTCKKRECVNCGKAYVPRQQQYKTFCGRECSYAHIQKTKEARRHEHSDGMHAALIAWKQCATCKAFGFAPMSKGCGKTWYCSYECRRHAWREHKQCVDCGAECGGRKRCLPCGEMELKRLKKESGPASRWRRKAAERRVLHEPIPSKSIFIRDNWTCHWCGIACRDTKDPTLMDAATLDHVVPISKGGNHTRDNLVCACRACNSFKSDALSLIYIPKLVPECNEYLSAYWDDATIPVCQPNSSVP